MNKLLTYVLLVILGIALGAGATRILKTPVDAQNSATKKADEPLYWVAPMDSNYRRDEPGKSPMGMDLVPVFANELSPGEIEISPQIVNSLGVRTTTVDRSRLDNTVQTVGYVTYDQDRLIHIHPRVDGWIERLYVTAQGDPVERGAPLYDLYSPQLVNAQEELLSALQRDNPLLISAAEDRLRALQLTDTVIAQVIRDRKVRQSVTFTSPQRGVLDSLNIRDGFFVSPDTTLMVIGALDEVWVEAPIFESQANAVSAGQRVTMQVDYIPGREWQGTVDYIYPALDEKTRTLRLRLRFDNADGVLRPNMFTRVQIHAGQDSPTLNIPRESLIRTGSQDRVVLALGNGRFRSIAVDIGRIAGNRVEVLQGLSAGDRIVSSAQFLLDSESSKTADFSRMDQATPTGHEMHKDHAMPMNHDEHKNHAMPMNHAEHRGHAMPESGSDDD